MVIYFPVIQLSFRRWQITGRSFILMQEPAVHLIRGWVTTLPLQWIRITSHKL